MSIFAKPPLLTAATATALALACGLGLVPGTANATDSRCPTNRFCLFENTNFGGGRAVFATSDANLNGNTYDDGHAVSSRAGSLINNAGRVVQLYSMSGYRGRVYASRPGSTDSNLLGNSGFVPQSLLFT